MMHKNKCAWDSGKGDEIFFTTKKFSESLIRISVNIEHIFKFLIKFVRLYNKYNSLDNFQPSNTINPDMKLYI